MDQESELTAEIIEAIEVCRHDSNDRDLPEVASVLVGAPAERVADHRQAIERFDRAVAGAMQQVSMPAGLVDRLLAAVQAHPSALEAASDHGPAYGRDLLARPAEPDERWDRPSVKLPDAEPTLLNAVGAGEGDKGTRRRLSRRLVMSGGLLTMAASVLVVLAWQGTREKLDAGDLLTRAKTFYEGDDHDAPFSGVSPSFAPSVTGVMGWRPVTFLSRDGAAFELSGPRRVRGTLVRATLYVVPRKSLWGPVFFDLPKKRVPQSTSGMTVAVWTDDKDVYVMIVKGDSNAFDSFFVQKFA